MYIFGFEKYAKKIGVTIGRNCRIYTTKFGSEPWLIEIGNNVTITSNVVLLTHDGATWLIRDNLGRRYSYGKIIIKDNVFVGINSIIMPGVTIENNVIIAAGSVVTKSIHYGTVVAGNPAKVIGKYSDYYDKVQLFVSEYDFKKYKSFKKATEHFSKDSNKKYL